MKSKDILCDIIEKIVSGDITEDSKLPSELQLSEMYQCNRHTIRKVMESLIERGYIRKTHGGPAFVNTIPSSHSLNIGSLYDLYLAKDIKTKVLKFQQIIADDNICEKLQIPVGSKVWHITRLRCVGEQVKHMEYIYMSVSLFPDLTRKHCEASLLSYIEYEKDYEITHGVKNISAVNVTKEEMAISKRTDNDLALKVENIGSLTNGRIYEYSISIHFDNSIEFHAKR